MDIQAEGYNCAETVLMLVGGKYYLNDINFNYANLVTGFGGGIGRSRLETCGALTGSVVALSMLIGRDDPSVDVDPIHEKVSAFRDIFLAKFKKSVCGELREGLEGEEAKMMCHELTAGTVAALFDYLDSLGGVKRNNMHTKKLFIILFAFLLVGCGGTKDMSGLTPKELFEKGGKAAKSHDLDLAVKYYTETIKLDPDYKCAYNNRGVIYFQTKRYSEAISDYNRALEIDPDYSLPYYNKGKLYHAQREYQKALEELSKSIEKNPRYKYAYNYRGLVYSSLKEYSKAMVDYNKTIDLDPDFATAYMNKGAYFCSSQRVSKSNGCV